MSKYCKCNHDTVKGVYSLYENDEGTGLESRCMDCLGYPPEGYLEKAAIKYLEKQALKKRVKLVYLLENKYVISFNNQEEPIQQLSGYYSEMLIMEIIDNSNKNTKWNGFKDNQMQKQIFLVSNRNE